jgi:hypothetical protein
MNEVLSEIMCCHLPVLVEALGKAADNCPSFLNVVPVLLRLGDRLVLVLLVLLAVLILLVLLVLLVLLLLQLNVRLCMYV